MLSTTHPPRLCPTLETDVKKEIDALLSSGSAREARGKLHEIQSRARRSGADNELAWLFRKEAQCDFLENRLDSARENALRAAQLAQKCGDQSEQADAYNSLGIIFGQKGELKQAVEYLKYSYEFHESAETGRGATALNNIGRIYEIMDEYERALEYFQNALSSLRKYQNNPHLEGTMLGNIGVALSSLNRHDEAFTVLHESIAVFEQHELDVPRAHALAKLADALVARDGTPGSDEAGQAEALYRDAIETNTARTEQSWNEELHGKLGSLLTSGGRYEEAKALLEVAIEGIVRERTTTESEAEWRSRYSEVLEHTGDLSEALRQQRLAYDALQRNYQHKLENRLHEALAVVELRRLEQENVDLAHKAEHDPLTALYNRRAFEARLREEIARARRYERPLALAMLDLDRFKMVNDTIGHIGGDQVLIATAQLIAGRSRTSDIVARYGGEEIAIIMPETDSEQAYNYCETLRRRIQTMNWAALGVTTAITASIGISGMRPDDSLEDLLERADSMLYRAKESGRNTVVA